MTEAVRQFFGCYFHQDWKQEYRDYQAAVDDFVKGANVKQLEEVTDFVDAYLSSGKPESFAMSEFGGFYRPEGDGISNIEFLKYVKSSILLNGLSRFT